MVHFLADCTDEEQKIDVLHLLLNLMNMQGELSPLAHCIVQRCSI